MEKIKKLYFRYRLLTKRGRLGQWLIKNKIATAKKDWREAFYESWQTWQDTEKIHRLKKDMQKVPDEIESAEEADWILSLYAYAPSHWRPEIWQDILNPERPPAWFKELYWTGASNGLTLKEVKELLETWRESSRRFIDKIDSPDVLLNYCEELAEEYPGKAQLKASFDIASLDWKPEHLIEVYKRICAPWFLSLPACKKIISLLKTSKEIADNIELMGGEISRGQSDHHFNSFKDNDRIQELKKFWYHLSLKRLERSENIREAQQALKKSPADILKENPEIAKKLIVLAKNYPNSKFIYDIILRNFGPDKIETHLALAKWSPLLLNKIFNRQIPLSKMGKIWESLPAGRTKELIFELIQREYFRNKKTADKPGE